MNDPLGLRNIVETNPNAITQPDHAAVERQIQQIQIKLEHSTNAQERAGLFLSKANLLRLLNRTREASEMLRLALAETPNDPSTQLVVDYVNGELYDDEGNSSKAYDLLSAVLAKHQTLLGLPDHRFIYEEIQRYRAFELFAMGNCENAIPLLEELLFFKSTERKSIIFAYLGNCYARSGSYEAARKCLLQAIELGDLGDWEGQAHYDLAKTYAFMHLLSDSKREFELCARRSVEYNLTPVKVYHWLYRVCRGLGEKGEADRYAQLARPT
jgi:tetratricopeptide (TPR) repeat protein